MCTWVFYMWERMSECVLEYTGTWPYTTLLAPSPFPLKPSLHPVPLMLPPTSSPTHSEASTQCSHQGWPVISNHKMSDGCDWSGSVSNYVLIMVEWWQCLLLQCFIIFCTCRPQLWFSFIDSQCTKQTLFLHFLSHLENEVRTVDKVFDHWMAELLKWVIDETEMQKTA